jgi:hypothetical protein
LLRFDCQHNDGSVLNGLRDIRGRDYMQPFAQSSTCVCVDFDDRDLARSYTLLQEPADDGVGHIATADKCDFHLGKDG